jgi:hypothetical protein
MFVDQESLDADIELKLEDAWHHLDINGDGVVAARDFRVFFDKLLDRIEKGAVDKEDPMAVEERERKILSGIECLSKSGILYPPLIPSSPTLLSYTPLIHSSHTLLSYTPPGDALLSLLLHVRRIQVGSRHH